MDFPWTSQNYGRKKEPSCATFPALRGTHLTLLFIGTEPPSTIISLLGLKLISMSWRSLPSLKINLKYFMRPAHQGTRTTMQLSWCVHAC